MPELLKPSRGQRTLDELMKLMPYRRIWILMMILLGSYIYVVSSMTPLFADDLCRAQYFNGISDILGDLKDVYLYQTGRLPVIFVTKLLLWRGTAGLAIFNIANAVIFVTLLTVIFMHARLRLPSRASDSVLLAFALASLWFLTPTFGEVVLWKTGAIGYLWAVTANLLFIYPYRRMTAGHEFPFASLFAPIMLVCGVLAGACLENLTVVVTAAITLLTFIHFRQTGRTPTWAITGILGYVTGAAILIAAPGNYVRMARIGNAMPFDEKIFQLAEEIVRHYAGSYLIFILLIPVLAWFLDRETFRKNISSFILFTCLSFAAAGAMAGAPVHFAGRVTFVSDVFALVGVCALIPETYKTTASKRLAGIAAAVTLTALIASSFMPLTFYKSLHEQDAERRLFIAQAKSRGLTQAHVQPYVLPDGSMATRESNHRWFYLRDISADSGDWKNLCSSQYYGLAKIALKP